jgi:hypothetical protein
MSTDSLRRELEKLQKAGHGDCKGCGYPSYKNVKTNFVVRLKGLPRKPGHPENVVEAGLPEDPGEPRRCPVCGRKRRHIVIRMKGLQDKPRGDGTFVKERTLPALDIPDTDATFPPLDE